MISMTQHNRPLVTNSQSEAFYSGARSEIALRLARSQNEHGKNFRVLAVISGGFYDKVARSMGLDILEGLLSVFTARLVRSFPINSAVANIYADHFVCLIEAPSREEFENSIQEGIRKLSESFSIGDAVIALDVKLGLVVAGSGPFDIDDLIREAFIAADQAQKDRRPWVFYDPSLETNEEDDLSVLAAVRAGLENQEFSLHYQPKLNLAEDRVDGFEALARWKCPKRGSIAPAVWIPVIERSSFINEFTDFVARSAFEQIVRWDSIGVRLPIAINVSANDLTDPQGAGGLVRLLKECQSLLPLIEIEVTETAVVNNFDEVAATLRTLRDLGVRVSIDDFGTGYSSLVYLREVPADTVKIDQLFIRSIARNKRDRCIVEASVSLAHGLGMTVVAEGVEDEETLNILRQVGCDSAQGYHISRPAPADEILRKFLSNEKPFNSPVITK
jgi:EAL domain-containing protein (putative c-di-GMP-specific phosphodiesterase class I)